MPTSLVATTVGAYVIDALHVLKGLSRLSTMEPVRAHVTSHTILATILVRNLATGANTIVGRVQESVMSLVHIRGAPKVALSLVRPAPKSAILVASIRAIANYHVRFRAILFHAPSVVQKFLIAVIAVQVSAVKFVRNRDIVRSVVHKKSKTRLSTTYLYAHSPKLIWTMIRVSSRAAVILCRCQAWMDIWRCHHTTSSI